ncbi:MAG: hypothetical protein PHX83_14135 [Acidobacteriia bacterium]|nr:hypothetical protein [Terriglobia bacterium]
MKSSKRLLLFPPAALAVLLCPFAGLYAGEETAATNQPVGSLISSDPVSVQGRTQWTTPTEEFDEPSLLVFGGNKISFPKGIAILQLGNKGGAVGFCGHTSVSMIPSKNMMLYGLQVGTVSLDVTAPTLDRIMTAEFVVDWKPQGGKKQGVVSSDDRGALCAQDIAGTLRIQDQLSGASLDLQPGLSVRFAPGKMNEANLLKDFDCGCSGPQASPSSSSITPAPESFDSTTIKNPPTSPSGAARPPVHPVVPPAIPPPRTVPISSPARVSSAMPQLEMASVQSPMPAKNISAEPRPVASATLAVSADDMQKASAKKSFGEKFKGFFRRLFSRK